MKSLLTLLILSTCYIAQSSIFELLDSTAPFAFQGSQIVPDVINSAPNKFITIVYPNDTIIVLGNKVTPTAVKDEPYVTWEADPNKFYTLTMTDPDEPNLSEVRHWLVVNIPGNNVYFGQTLFEFIGSAPSLNTGYHRYAFLVFEQPGIQHYNQAYVSNTETTGRFNQSLQDFADANNLGAPYAGNFYLAQYDSYTPILHAQLGLASLP